MLSIIYWNIWYDTWKPNGVVATDLDDEILVCDFELTSRYYVQFPTNTFSKGMNPLSSPVMC